MKKRIISLVCLIILCMSLTVPAMATEGTPNYSIRSQQVLIEEPLTLYEDPSTSGRYQYYISGISNSNNFLTKSAVALETIT